MQVADTIQGKESMALWIAETEYKAAKKVRMGLEKKAGRAMVNFAAEVTS